MGSKNVYTLPELTAADSVSEAIRLLGKVPTANRHKNLETIAVTDKSMVK